MATGREIITAALRKLNAASANSEPTAEDINLGLETLNALIESKSNEFLNIHTIRQQIFPLVAGEDIYTIGPTGDWVTPRPIRIEKVRLLMNPEVYTPEVAANSVTGVFTPSTTIMFGPVGISAPTASFTCSPISGEPPLTVTFTNTSVGEEVLYFWDFGDGNTSTETNPTHTYSEGVFTATLTVVNCIGTSTATTTITVETVLPAPVAQFSVFPGAAGSAPLFIDFIDESTGYVTSYLWDFGDGSEGATWQYPSHTYTTPGTYYPTLTVSGPGGTSFYSLPSGITVF